MNAFGYPVCNPNRSKYLIGSIILVPGNNTLSRPDLFDCLYHKWRIFTKLLFFYLLNVTNVIKFRCTLNFLLVATLAVMDKFLSDYKGKDRDNAAGSILFKYRNNM
jgi:hypothetical protein